MDYSTVHNLTVQFENEEVETFLEIVNKIKKGVDKTAGFKKAFNKTEMQLVNEMFEKFIGSNEEDTN